MPLLWNDKQWRDSYRGYVRVATGKGNARINSKSYPWHDQITLTEGEELKDNVRVSTADVLNCAIAQKQGLTTVLQDALITAEDKTSTLLQVRPPGRAAESSSRT
jgi:hypothetical protein